MIKPIKLVEATKADSTLVNAEKRAKAIFKVLVDCNLIILIGTEHPNYNKKLKYSQVKKSLTVEIKTPREYNYIRQLKIEISSYNDIFEIKGKKRYSTVYTIPWKYMEMDSKKFIDMCKKKGFIKTLKM